MKTKTYRLQLSYRINQYRFNYELALEAVSEVVACATATVSVLCMFQDVTEFKAEVLA